MTHVRGIASLPNIRKLVLLFVVADVALDETRMRQIGCVKGTQAATGVVHVRRAIDMAGGWDQP
eukprot:12930844-Prorocentrum_lima.AAC.1